MAFNAGSVTANLELGVGSFVASLDKATKALDEFGREGKQAETGVFSFGGALGTLRDLAIVIPAAFHLVSEAVHGVVDVFTEAVNAAGQLELKTIQLGATLAAFGERGVGQATEELTAYAEELSKVTAFSNTTVIAVEQTLAQFGLQGEKLKEATKAVLDYASVTGGDAVDAARLIGQTFDGTAGRIGQLIPALQGLTAAQLKNGGAVDVLVRQYDGLAEKVGQTTLGLREQLTNAFGNITEALGKAIGPGTDAVFKGLREGADAVTKLISDNANLIKGASLTVASAIVSMVEPTVRLGTALAVLAGQFVSFSVSAGGNLLAFFQAGRLQLEEFANGTLRVQLALQNMLALIPGLGDHFAEVATATREAIAQSDALISNIEKSAVDTLTNTDAIADAVTTITDQFEKAGDAAAAHLDTSKIQLDIQKQANELGHEEEKSKKIVDQLEGSIGQRIAQRKAHLDEILGTTKGTAAAAQDVAAATETAAGATTNLAEAAASAEDSFSSMADSADSISASESGSGGGSGGGGDAFGRHKGGSAGFDLSNLAGAESALSAATANLRGTHGSAFAGQTQVRAARGVVNQIQARVDALRAQAQQDATKEILDALDRQGILDPTARQSYIDQRLNEARRLGVVPTTGRAPVVAGFARI